ncbi:helix-turn-helix domain-containing protein [Brevibacillus ginsengisoli]|uniref:helix-turn-helix domain-containing protein n=1 Tax=Brevibacillus ginsengisoli TaxID=363854 RepID=UPI003CE69CB8
MMTRLAEIPEQEFCTLVHDAQRGNNQAIETLLELFEPNMEKLSWFIRMPREDSKQYMRLELLQMIQGNISIK